MQGCGAALGAASFIEGLPLTGSDLRGFVRVDWCCVQRGSAAGQPAHGLGSWLLRVLGHKGHARVLEFQAGTQAPILPAAGM